MNRKIIISGISIVSALTLMVGGAFAAFSSANTNTGNTFGAGTLSLQINTQTGTSTGVFSVTNATPGVAVSQDLLLKNGGSVDASSVQVSGITLGGVNPELAGDVTLVFFHDTNANGVLDGGETVLGTAHLNDGVWTGYTLPGVALSAGGTYELGAQVTLDLTAPNSDQGKNMTFDLGFQANQ